MASVASEEPPVVFIVPPETKRFDIFWFGLWRGKGGFEMCDAAYAGVLEEG